MAERTLTCIICPRGCALDISLDDGGTPTEVRGNACPRGERYAFTECTAPMRTVTTTVRCATGGVVPVKTDKPVPKNKVFEVMREINALLAPDGVRIGDVLIADILGTGADIVVTGKV